MHARVSPGPGRSPVPTAQPSPARASRGSAVLEQGSGRLLASPAHPSVAPWPNPRHCCPPVWNTGNRRNRPSLHASGGSCCPHWPEPPSLPQTRARGVGGGGPSPVCMHLCREHCGQETQPVGPDGWGHSLVLCHSLAEAILSPEGRRACPLASLLSLPGLRQRRPSPPQGFSHPVLSPPRGQGWEGFSSSYSALLHSHKFLVQLSTSRPQNSPEGSVVSHLHLKGSAVTTGWTPPDTAH